MFIQQANDGCSVHGCSRHCWGSGSAHGSTHCCIVSYSASLNVHIHIVDVNIDKAKFDLENNNNG